jgi:orotidine-5'-phosphate decarboxylase
MRPIDRLAVALDVGSPDEAETLAGELSGAAGVFKVGLELFTAAGPGAAKRIARHGQLFLDLKLHDIPNTVEAAAREAAKVGATYLTVHAAGGRAMIQAAVRGAGSKVKVLAVSVLTSLTASDLDEVGLRGTPREAALRLAKLAVGAGAAGVVCSPEEVGELRRTLGPGPLLVVPGIRPVGSARGDQKRTGTPAEAITAGASVLVVGRPIREAPSPREAAEAIVREIAGEATADRSRGQCS